MPSKRRRVAVVFGGRSAEHEISCISARSVIDALSTGGNDVVAIGITREGRWYLLPGPPALPAETGRMPEITEGSGSVVELASDSGASELVSADGTRESIDVVFPVLHGPYGEDGAVQGLLQLADVPFVGAGVLGSAIGLDKDVQKRLFRDAGLPVVAHEVVRESEWSDDREGVEARADALGYPLFSKPATLGSSVGVVKVHAAGELSAGLGEAFRYARKALLEAAVPAPREVEVAVLGNDDPVASVPGEIVPQGHEFYDYEAKYLDEDGAQLLIPADLKPEVGDELQRLAIAAFRTAECSGLARVDFFLMGEEELFINEINTIPGFTAISMYPKLWGASGLSYPQLVERLIELALERHEAERGKSSSARELAGGASSARAASDP